MVENSLLLGFYGDDFTGSTDVMEALTRGGLRTLCFVKHPTEEDLARFEGLQAFGITGLSRTMTPKEMEEELIPAFQAIRDLKSPLIHYKTCSTFDSSPEIGSIGKAIDIGSEVFESPYVPVVIGAPILGRYVVFGNIFARSGLDTEPFRLDLHPTMSRHPITPMDESDIRLILSKQTQKSSALFDILAMSKSIPETEILLDSLLQENPEIVVFDTLYDEQLPKVGNLLLKEAQADKPLFIVGSSGVEYCLCAHWQAKRITTARIFPDPGKVDQLLTLSGSCSPVTEGQIEWALQNGSVEVPLKTDELLEEKSMLKECERTAREALEQLDQGHSVIVHTAKGPNDARIASTSQLLKERGYSEMDCKIQSGRFFGEALGQVFLNIIEQKPLKRVATTGGDTSGHFARKVGIEAIEMLGPLAPGSPLCILYKNNSPLDQMEITFKGGQVGKKDYLGVVQRGTP